MKVFTCQIFEVPKQKQKLSPNERPEKPKPPVLLDTIRVRARNYTAAKRALTERLKKMGKRVRAVSPCPHDKFVAYVLGR